MTQEELLTGAKNRVEIRKNDAGYHEIFVDGTKIERCTGFKAETVDPRGRLLNVTISFYSGHVDIGTASPAKVASWAPDSVLAPSWRERIQERGEDTP